MKNRIRDVGWIIIVISIICSCRSERAISGVVVVKGGQHQIDIHYRWAAEGNWLEEDINGLVDRLSTRIRDELKTVDHPRVVVRIPSSAPSLILCILSKAMGGHQGFFAQTESMDEPVWINVRVVFDHFSGQIAGYETFPLYSEPKPFSARNDDLVPTLSVGRGGSQESFWGERTLQDTIRKSIPYRRIYFQPNLGSSAQEWLDFIRNVRLHGVQECVTDLPLQRYFPGIEIEL